MNKHLVKDKPYCTPMAKSNKVVRWVVVIFLEILSLPMFIIFSMKGHLLYALVFGILTFVAPIRIIETIHKPF